MQFRSLPAFTCRSPGPIRPSLNSKTHRMLSRECRVSAPITLHRGAGGLFHLIVPITTWFLKIGFWPVLDNLSALFPSRLLPINWHQYVRRRQADDPLLPTSSLVLGTDAFTLCRRSCNAPLPPNSIAHRCSHVLHDYAISRRQSTIHPSCA